VLSRDGFECCGEIMKTSTDEKILAFIQSVARSACLDQIWGDKCRCFSCEANALLNEMVKS